MYEVGGAFLSSTYDVLLVRHGESEANAAGRLACHTWDPHLTKIGQSQAETLVQQLQHVPIEAIVTSPLSRARETLSPLAHAKEIHPVVLDDLAEVDLGQWDGKRLIDLENSDNLSFVAWRKDPEKNPPPGGESILAVGHRVLNTLKEFVMREKPVLTIAGTHADCIKGALLVVTQSPGPAARTISVPNCGQLMIRFHPSFQRWALVLGPFHFPDSIE